MNKSHILTFYFINIIIRSTLDILELKLIRRLCIVKLKY